MLMLYSSGREQATAAQLAALSPGGALSPGPGSPGWVCSARGSGGSSPGGAPQDPIHPFTLYQIY
jgi:hypothetical protein